MRTALMPPAGTTTALNACTGIGPLLSPFSCIAQTLLRQLMTLPIEMHGVANIMTMSCHCRRGPS